MVLPPWIARALAPPRGPDAADGARLDRLAADLHRLGLAVPALAFAAAQRPLLHLYGQCLRLVSPLLPPPAEAWAALLEDPGSLDRFLEQLEALLAGEGGHT